MRFYKLVRESIACVCLVIISCKLQPSAAHRQSALRPLSLSLLLLLLLLLLFQAETAPQPPCHHDFNDYCLHDVGFVTDDVLSSSAAAAAAAFALPGMIGLSHCRQRHRTIAAHASPVCAVLLSERNK